MAKILGILERAQIEILDADPSPGLKGRIFYNSTDSKFKIDNGSAIKEIAIADLAQTLTNKTIVAASNTITTTAIGNLSATELNAALAELQADIDTRATDAALTSHIGDATAAHAASAVSFNSAGTGIASTDVQAALVAIDSIAAAATQTAGTALSDAASAQADIDTHVAATAAHGATGAVVGTTNTQTLTNKTLTAPVLDVASLTEQSSTPSTPSSGTKKFYAKNDGKLYTLNSSGAETEVGSGAASSGGGLINYIDNGTAESDTLGWTQYSEGTTRPVDGAGGTSNSTWTRSTTSPLRGTASFLWTKSGSTSRQGNGVSYEFTIDRADQAKLLQIEIDYEVVSGTYSGGTSSTDSDLIVDIYDAENGGLIEPSTIKLSGAVVGVKNKYLATFQTASNSITYRLMIHTATTSASDFSVRFDGISVGPQIKNVGAPITNAVRYTPTLNNGGTTSTNAGAWRQVGDHMEVEAIAIFTGAGSAATFNVQGPSGYAVDGNKTAHTSGLYGTCSWFDASASQERTGFVNLLSYNPIQFTCVIDNNGASALQGNSLASGDYVRINARVPIAGWSSSVSMSSADTQRAVVCSVNTTATAINGTLANIVFTNKVLDTTNSFSTTTGQWTCPISGWYHAEGAIYSSGTFGLDTRVNCMLRINSSDIAASLNRAGGAITNMGSGVATFTRFLNAGDTVYLQGASTATSAAIAADTTLTYLNIRRLPNNQTIAASETISARYVSGADQSMSGSPTVINFGTRSHDTHGAVTVGASWKFTAPANGIYRFYGVVHMTMNGVATNQAAIQVNKNGSGDGYLSFYEQESTNSALTIPLIFNDSRELRAGEYISIAGLIGSGSPTSLSALGTYSYITVERVGSAA